MQFTFYKAADKLLVNAKQNADTFKIKIVYMELYIRKIIINESVYSAIEARLAQKQLLKYNFNRIDVSAHIVQGKLFQLLI